MNTFRRAIYTLPAPIAYADGEVTLPPSAAERGSFQPVISVTANGASRGRSEDQ